MKRWIFKLIYMPIGLCLLSANMAIILAIMREAKFEALYNWLLIIMVIAIFIDSWINNLDGAGHK